jgi:AhpC/TSA family.
MSLTYSSMLPLGTKLIAFELIDTVSEKNFSSDEFEISKPTLIMFICNHCPYVIHYHSEIQKIYKDYKDQINMVAISSNDIDNYPQDAPEHMQDLWKELGLSFPYLFDETQMVAKAYKAECTPEFYLFDSNRKLVYRGRLDESSPNSAILPSGKDLRDAIENLLNEREISLEQFPSMGCNIKWK